MQYLSNLISFLCSQNPATKVSRSILSLITKLVHTLHVPQGPSPKQMPSPWPGSPVTLQHQCPPHLITPPSQSWRLSTDPDTGLTSLLDCGQAPLASSQPSLDDPQARCSFQHRASGHPAPSTSPLLSHIHSPSTQNLYLINRFPPLPNFHPSSCSLCCPMT